MRFKNTGSGFSPLSSFWYLVPHIVIKSSMVFLILFQPVFCSISLRTRSSFGFDRGSSHVHRRLQNKEPKQ